MAELSLRERLQPALLDRLIDDERLLTMFELTFRRSELLRLKLTERDLTDILQGQGLRAVTGSSARPTDSAGVPAAGAGDELPLTLAAPSGRVTLSQLKSLVLKPPGMPQGIALAAFCTIAARNVLNATAETGDGRSVSARRLREYVCRDLASLLNSNSLDVSEDLSSYPEVRQSVLNFGMPSLAGRNARSVEPQKTAARMEEVIRRFEPRLSKVRVLPEIRDDGGEAHVLAFRIEAELWGQPLPQHLVLRTRVDIDSGDVSVAESGAK
jgi:type VI secretion system protein ImpF